jgi:hypothetical protein
LVDCGQVRESSELARHNSLARMACVETANFERVFDINTLHDPHATTEMKKFYDTHGIVCIALKQKINVREVVGQMVELLLGQLPYIDECMLNLKSESGRELHIKNPEDREGSSRSFSGPSSQKKT